MVLQNVKRVDKHLEPKKAVVQKMKNGNYCFHYYLKGKCFLPFCPKSHALQNLSDQEFDALWLVARQVLGIHRGVAGLKCTDRFCLMGHQNL